MLNEIKKQVSKVVQYSQGIPNPKVDELLDDWLDAKRRFIQFFGGCIYEVPYEVTFHIDEKAKDRRVDELLSYIDCFYDNRDLVDFISKNKSGFYKNIVLNDTTYNDKKSPKGQNWLNHLSIL